MGNGKRTAVTGSRTYQGLGPTEHIHKELLVNCRVTQVHDICLRAQRQASAQPHARSTAQHHARSTAQPCSTRPQLCFVTCRLAQACSCSDAAVQQPLQHCQQLTNLPSEASLLQQNLARIPEPQKLVTVSLPCSGSCACSGQASAPPSPGPCSCDCCASATLTVKLLLMFRWSFPWSGLCPLPRCLFQRQLLRGWWR